MPMQKNSCNLDVFHILMELPHLTTINSRTAISRGETSVHAASSIHPFLYEQYRKNLRTFVDFQTFSNVSRENKVIYRGYLHIILEHLIFLFMTASFAKSQNTSGKYRLRIGSWFSPGRWVLLTGSWILRKDLIPTVHGSLERIFDHPFIKS